MDHLDGAAAARSPTTGSAGGGAVGALAAAGERLALIDGVRPLPPSTPRPSNLAVNFRRKFANHSVASLPTAVETGDLEERADDSSDGCSDSDSMLLLEDMPSEGEGLEVGSSDDCCLPRLSEQSSWAGSDIATDCLSLSMGSERDPDEVDELIDGEEFLCQTPLLNIEEGVRPITDRRRHPPITWLRAAGFEMPGSEGFDLVPEAPVCGERPKRYLDLFCRQMLARERTSDLSVHSLDRHRRALGSVRHTTAVPEAAEPAEPLQQQNGAWLEAFIAKARAVPLSRAAEEVVGADMGAGVAAFLDSLSDDSGADASLADEDAPDGFLVTGQQIRSRPVERGRGRCGFIVDCDAPICVPGRSASPRPQRARPPLSWEPPRPPLILGPLQPYSQRRLQ